MLLQTFICSGEPISLKSSCMLTVQDVLLSISCLFFVLLANSIIIKVLFWRRKQVFNFDSFSELFDVAGVESLGVLERHHLVLLLQTLPTPSAYLLMLGQVRVQIGVQESLALAQLVQA
jgi:hypothetical protein